jgi:chromosome partitioning protein
MLIDCPPSLNILTLNAFVAADSVLVPIQCEYYALEGLSALLDTIEGIREAVNENLVIEGLLRTMYDGRNNLGVEVSAQLMEHFGDEVFRTIVPRNIRLAEAPSHGMSIVKYDKHSRGALAYLALAGELLRRQARQSAALAAEPEVSPNSAGAEIQEPETTVAAQDAVTPIVDEVDSVDG